MSEDRQASLDEVVEEYAEEGDAEEDTDEWMTETLGELAEYQNGNAFSKDEWSDSGYPIIRIQNLTGEQEEYNYFDGELDDQYRVEDGDILLSWSATIDLFEWRGETAALNQHIYRVDTSNEVNDQFFKFKLEEVIPRLVALSHGSTMKHVRKADLVNLDVELPPLSEQRKIASVLYNVDEAIRKTEEIIEQTKRVKKGVMQELFTEGYYEHEGYRETKYGQIPEEWEVTQISEIAKQIQAGGTPDTDEDSYYGGDIYWVKTGELSADRVTETEQTITQTGLEESTARMFPTKTVLVAMYGATTGEVSRLEVEASTNQACCGIVTDDNKADSRYLHQQLLHLQDSLIALSAGSGQQNIRKQTIENFDILLPSLDEQREIADTLDNLDSVIRENQRLIDELETIKRALMQDLLTGEVRTKDRDIEVLPEVEAHG